MAGLISIRSGASTALAAALAASLLVNAGGAWLYLRQRDAVAGLRRDIEHAGERTADALASADACTKSVKRLRAAADAAAKAAQQARAEATRSARQRYQQADQILAAPAAVPGDACASAQARVANVLGSRERRAEP